MTNEDQPTGIVALFRRMGPAWLVSAIAAGPATMASVITAGIAFGFPLLWVVVLSAVAGSFAQYLAMRLGLRTEEGIVTTVSSRLGRVWAWIVVVDVFLAAGLAQLIIMKTVAGVSTTVLPVLGDKGWSVFWAIVLAIGLATGGYKFAERAAKALVVAIVLAFVASLFVIDWNLGQALTVFQPSFPPGAEGALLVAAVLGGAVHISIITMQSYNMRARGWTMRHYGLARTDVIWSMLIMFGLYSAAIFLVTSAVLHGQELAAGPPHIQASLALEPLVGAAAKWLFLFGLLGAAVSTLGGNTIVAPYLIADQLRWKTDVRDARYRGLVIAFALASGIGGFLGGAFFDLLVLVIAFGLIATPFALFLVLVLLNTPESGRPTPPWWANLAGSLIIAVTGVVAGNHVWETMADGIRGVLDWLVVLFALGNALALVGLVIKAIRDHGRPEPVRHTEGAEG